MCGRYSAYIDLLTATRELDAQLVAEGYVPSANVAPMQLAPLLVDRGGRRLGLARFGLTLPPRTADERPLTVINARSETASRSPVFRDSLAHRRGVALADGYYEWQTVGPGRTPHFLRPRAGGYLFFAALFEIDKAASLGHRNPRFALFTRDARGVAAQVHDRMPVFVPSSRLDEWLDARNEDGDRLLAEFVETPVDLRAHPVGRSVGKVGVDGLALHEPTGPDLHA